MHFTVYSKDNCSFCDRAIRLLEKRRVNFNLLKIGKNIDVDAFKEKFPDVRTVPYILEGGKPIGGYDQLVKRFNESVE